MKLPFAEPGYVRKGTKLLRNKGLWERLRRGLRHRDLPVGQLSLGLLYQLGMMTEAVIDRQTFYSHGLDLLDSVCFLANARAFNRLVWVGQAVRQRTDALKEQLLKEIERCPPEARHELERRLWRITRGYS